jgi:hypothetical protein
MRRRIHVARSSNACISISRNSDAPVNTTRYGSWSNVIDMFASRTMPAMITALSGRRCPNTAYAVNCPAAHTIAPSTMT